MREGGPCRPVALHVRLYHYLHRSFHVKFGVRVQPTCVKASTGPHRSIPGAKTSEVLGPAGFGCISRRSGRQETQTETRASLRRCSGRSPYIPLGDVHVLRCEGAGSVLAFDARQTPSLSYRYRYGCHCDDNDRRGSRDRPGLPSYNPPRRPIRRYFCAAGERHRQSLGAGEDWIPLVKHDSP